MSYTTIGTIASLRWTYTTPSATNTKLFFTIDPIPSYSFEEKKGAAINKFVLWDDGTTLSKVPQEDEYEITTDSSMNLSALLLLKQNHSKVKLESSAPATSPAAISSISVIS